ncbi:MAG TPA: DEAD/DEAH box helicase [Candidatus Merdenecus merdavium]|nr:DEAD/DEAH box helicase [Candidatus Merdenecus merdavium]
MEIVTEAIKEKTSSLTYSKGVQLHKSNKVFGIREYVDGDIFHISAEIERRYSASYHVVLEYQMEEEEIIDYQCECSDYWSSGKMCVHCVAVALEFAKEKEDHKAALEEFLKAARKTSSQGEKNFQRPITSLELSDLIYEYSMKDRAKFLQPKITGLVELEPTLHRKNGIYTMDVRVGISTKYVVKDLHSFIRSIHHQEKVDYGKKLGFVHQWSAFTKESRELIQYLEKYLKEYEHYKFKSTLYYQYVPSIRALELTDEAVGDFLNLMIGKWFRLEWGYEGIHRYFVIEGNPEISVKLQRLSSRNGYELLLPPITILGDITRLYLKKGDMIYQCDEEYSHGMERIFRLGDEKNITRYFIDEKDMGAFCSTILPVLEQYTNLEVEGDVSVYLPKEAELKIYLDNPFGYIVAKIEAVYDEQRFNVLDPIGMGDIIRDINKEQEVLAVAKPYFEGETEDQELYLLEEREDDVYKLLTKGVHDLSRMGDVFISETLRRLRVLAAPKVNIGVSITGDLLNLSMDAGHLSQEELEDFLSSYRKRKKYFRLKNGDFMEFEDSSISAVSELVEGLELGHKDLQSGEIQVPSYRAFYIDQVLKGDGENVEVLRDSSYKQMIRTMKSVEDSDYEVPKTLRKVLRGYQRIGFRWLCSLDSMGFGGILADDMGLGKTLQVIAYLFYQKQISTEQKTSLIVCPSSLVYNWLSEIERFAPKLSVLMITGTSDEREQLLKTYNKYDVLITSYDLLRRDIGFYEKKEFYAQIIDEAQYIKNHSTQIAKAIKKVRSKRRFALTGTPIENRLSELWSIFDYLMKGFLGSYKSFKTKYETPIISTKDDVTIKRLQRIIKPFILRRIKADVLKELPEKEETIIYSKLEGEQLALYQANVQRVMQQLASRSKEEFSRGKLQVLAELTKLRQICCAPAMVYDNYGGGSAKIDTCMELIRNAIEGGHKILLFSQFTSLFLLLEQELKKEKIDYYKLIGSTPKEERTRLVNEFNENDIPIFLISLKAGGTGLNLTGATIVIHFDPWWNVAAQNQATDRAHRIGQKNSVTVFKLIAKNTIEEKILKMQEAKKDLSDQIITGDGVSVTHLTKEDFMGILEP